MNKESKFIDVLCYIEVANNMDNLDMIVIRDTDEDLIEKCQYNEYKFEYVNNEDLDLIYEEVLDKEELFVDSYMYLDGIMCEFNESKIYLRTI